jgi:hypothetical protein
MEDDAETRQERRDKKRKSEREKVPQHGKTSLQNITHAIVKRGEDGNQK